MGVSLAVGFGFLGASVGTITFDSDITVNPTNPSK